MELGKRSVQVGLKYSGMEREAHECRSQSGYTWDRSQKPESCRILIFESILISNCNWVPAIIWIVLDDGTRGEGYQLAYVIVIRFDCRVDQGGPAGAFCRIPRVGICFVVAKIRRC
jgi:hypothetical protein